MTLKELRNSKQLTQKQVSEMVGISLRSYKQYENENDKKNTIKYMYIFERLSEYGYIDENTGVLELETIKQVVSEVFEIYPVEYCFLFGSYSTNEANESSDVDLLVSTKITGMDFFGLAEVLREKLHKKVDLLNVEQLSNNTELLNEVLKKGIKIYG